MNMDTTPVDAEWEGWDYLRELQHFCRANSVAKGFGKEADKLHELIDFLIQLNQAGDSRWDQDLINSLLSSYFSKRLNLIHDELAEGHEELRSGKAPDEEYRNDKPGKEGKPEGIPSELADVIIRVLDLAGEYEIDMADVIFGKTAYNASRDAMHGRRF